MRRAAARALGERGPSTAAQEALRLEREAHKRERAVLSRAERERIAATKWQKHVAKQQARRRGH